MRSIFCQIFMVFTIAKAAIAVQPLGGVMVLAKRQAVCVGPVICSQTVDACTSCEAGFYCSGGGCCEEGQSCAGFKPCVNAGSQVRDPEETQVCPTDAPICTASDLIPICSGGPEDWATISRALGGGAQTTDVETPIFSTRSFNAPATSISEFESTSTSEFETESSTSFEESTTPAPTFGVETTVGPETTGAARTTSSRGAGPTTTTSTPNSSPKMQLSLGLVAVLMLAASLLN